MVKEVDHVGHPISIHLLLRKGHRRLESGKSIGKGTISAGESAPRPRRG